MKAVRFHEHGGLEKLQVEDIPIPEIGPGELLIRVKACALNHLDIWIRQGIPAYQIPLPHVSGCDISGVIEQINEPNEQGLFMGQSVFVSPGLSCWHCEQCLGGQDNLCSSYQILGAQVEGGYAEYVKVPISNVFSMPPSLTFEEAAAFPLVGVTAWHMVVTLAKVRSAETVLVVGAGSGVGAMAVQIARLLGARVFTTVGSKEKVAKAQSLGAEAIINHVNEDIEKRVRHLTGGRGVDVVIEHVGEKVWDQCIRMLARGGRLVTCGATTGGQVKVDARVLFSRQLTLMGSYMGTRAEFLEATKMVGLGKLHPVVDCVMPLSEARNAQERLLSRKNFGKVVLATI